MASAETDFLTLLPELTLEEKVALLSGQDFSTAAGNARLGITPIRVADTVCGIRGSGLESELGTATFPNTVCYGSTWDADLLEELGQHLAQQARSKSAQVILGPTINIHRDPRGGRNFECFSEDPLLSGQLAGAIVNGIQSLGVGVCPKHFVCNDSETLRHYYDVKESVNSRTLREVYLAAWQHLFRVSSPEGVMMAYNKVDGTYCSASKDLIQGVLRGDWGYQGIAMSDWFGTKDIVGPVKAGLDLEMPFPVFRGGRLIEQVKLGAVTEAEIDVLVSRMLQLRNRTRACHGINAERSEVNEETNKMAWELATGGMVLLKNEGNVLPFDAAKTPKIALVGEYAADPVITGGGSASSIPQYKHSPLQILQKELPGSVKYAPGVRTRRIIPEAKPEKLALASGEPGVTVKFFNKDAEAPVLQENQPRPHVWMLGQFKDKLEAVGSRMEMSTKLKPDTTGRHTLAVRCTGSFSLFVNGAKVLDGKVIKISTEQFIFNHTLLESRVEYFMNAQEAYDIHLVMDGPQKLTIGEPTPYAATLCFEEYYSEEEAIKEAVEIAQASDISIVYAGRNDQYESEGFDLEDIRMPENQTELIKRVAAASKATVLVLHCGNPIDVSAVVDDVDAILLAHFPGQEGAQATIDLLRGKACPSGRLSTTWFKTLEDSPSYGNFPCKKTDDGAVEISYAEGLGVGYRAPDKEDRIRWPFGYGLSYTSFEYKDLKVSVDAESKKLQCSVTVQNTGPVAGKEVVQVYIKPSADTTAWRPQKELKAFKKVQLKPGETATVEIEVDVDVACSYWDEGVNAWRLDAGTYTAAVGNLTQDFAVQSGHTWNHL